MKKSFLQEKLFSTQKIFQKLYFEDQLIPNIKDIEIKKILKKFDKNLKKKQIFKKSKYFLHMSKKLKKL